ncbi:MAG: LptF/LptG family permease [Rhodobacter sp.]|nr:LptF/LptG family permease [Rhodobacter sp.]
MIVAGRMFRAFFGIAARRAVWDYLRFVALIMFILLAIAWTIDLAEHFAFMRRDAERQGLPVHQLLLPYLAYRSADMVARMLPMACFFGVFLAEIARRARLETVIFTAAGASPLRMVAAVLIFGILAGGLQQWLEAYGRPAAVAAQIRLGHGDYAERFRPHWTRGHVWFLGGDMAVRARILRDDPPAMRDVLIFSGLRQPHLQTIYSAKRVDPTDVPFLWHLQGVEKWRAAAGQDEAEPQADLTLRLDLIPEQLTYYRMPGFYLHTEPLRRLAQIDSAPRTVVDANMALWRRRVVWVLPGALALLAVCLTKFGYSGRQPNVPRLIALALFGYVTVVSIKVLWAVGELGGLPAPVAVLASVGFILGVSGWLLRKLS